MKLKNKKTGEIVEATDFNIIADYATLAELNEEWEDYEEPKSVIKDIWFNSTLANGHFVEIDFISDEEAERAVEKLKAWKRLRDKGFRFDGYRPDFEGFWVIYPNDTEGTWCLAEDKKDLDLLFGCEE